MSYAQIIEIESARQEVEKWNVIHLFKEGNFYRAYDWSAWLISVCSHNDDKDNTLKVIAKALKDGSVNVFVGFPASSIAKFIPQYIEFLPINDTMIDVRIELPVEFGEISFESLSKMKEDWKNSQPITESKKQRRENKELSEQAPRITRLSDVITRIMAIPLERVSPKEAWDILSDLRRQISEIY